MTCPTAVCLQALQALVRRPTPTTTHKNPGASMAGQKQRSAKALATRAAHVLSTGVHLGIVLFEQLEVGKVLDLPGAGNVVLALHHRAVVGGGLGRRHDAVTAALWSLKGDVLAGDDLGQAVNSSSMLGQLIQSLKHLKQNCHFLLKYKQVYNYSIYNVMLDQKGFFYINEEF